MSALLELSLAIGSVIIALVESFRLKKQSDAFDEKYPAEHRG